VGEVIDLAAARAQRIRRGRLPTRVRVSSDLLAHVGILRGPNGVHALCGCEGEVMGPAHPSMRPCVDCETLGRGDG
jgi:hypothetical protein